MSGRRRRDTLALIFAVTGGAWAWTFQLWLAWILGEPLCFLQPGEFSLFGLGSAWLWVLVSLITGAVCLAALGVSWRMWRRHAGSNVADEPSVHGLRRFLLYVGLVLNALFLLTIVMGATGPLWLAPCV